MIGSDHKLLAKLVLAEVRRHPARMAITIFAIVASAAIVVWVVSGYDSLVKKFDEFSSQHLGRYHLVILPAKPPESSSFDRRPPPALSMNVIDALRWDSTVSAVDAVIQLRARIVKADAQPSTPNPKQDTPPMLVGTDARQPPYSLAQGEWIDQSQPDLPHCAVSLGTAEKLDLKLNDLVSITASRVPSIDLKIVGIVNQQQRLPHDTVNIRGPTESAVYVPLKLAEKISGKSAEIAFAGVELRPDATPEHFRTRWEELLAGSTPAAEIQTIEDVDAELQYSGAINNVRAQAYAATGISLLAALFIIFTTLSMGVHERIRQLAILRAVGLTKLQIGGMIALESVLLGLIGWAGGLLAGWALLKFMVSARPGFFPAGASLGNWCVLLSGICALGGALIACLVPAWKATSISPLDAMGPATSMTSHRFPWLATLIGAPLVLVNPLLVFFVPMPDTARYGASAAIGYSSMAVGFVLLTPIIIVGTEKLLGPLLARIMRLHPRLLASQLSSNLWRTLGTTVALTLGLGLFVAMQTWGYTMLEPFLPGNWMPDLLIAFPAEGVPETELQALRNLKGIAGEQFLPLAVEQPKFAQDITGAKQRASVTRQNNCLMVGVDPQLAFGGERPMLDVRFIEGNRASALDKLKRGRFCLVPDHFQRETGLGRGDKFTLIPPNSPDQHVQYEIAGVVSLKGWHLITKGGLRTRDARTAALVLAPFDEVRHDFAIDRIRFAWTNLDGAASKPELQAAIQSICSGNASPEAKSARSSKQRRSAARLQFTSQMRQSTQTRADQIIWGLSQLPLVTLLVTSMGVVNTILASLRARRWEMGVLRAIGVTRFGLIRLVLSEAILVGLVACLLSLAFGVLAGYCGAEVSRYTDMHGGAVTPLVVPWQKLLIGFSVTLFLCFIAGLMPAINAGSSEPLSMLQSGRNAGSN